MAKIAKNEIKSMYRWQPEVDILNGAKVNISPGQRFAFFTIVTVLQNRAVLLRMFFLCENNMSNS